jgi:hypothetical protein
MIPLVPALLVTAVVAALIAALEATTALGAHPFWAAKTVWIGAPIGLIIAGIAAHRNAPKLPFGFLFFVLSVAAFALTMLGKSRFVASSGEDGFAGQLCFLAEQTSKPLWQTQPKTPG